FMQELNCFKKEANLLLFAIARDKILPKSFEKVHPKYGTPHIAVIFTILLSALAPWFGREALEWVVDMSSIGVSIAYFYTCLTAFKLFKWDQRDVIYRTKQEAAPVTKIISL